MTSYRRKCVCGAMLFADGNKQTVQCNKCQKKYRLGWTPHLIEV